jgi:hypothetical protein
MEATPPVSKKWVEITDATSKGDFTRDQDGQITQLAQWGPGTPEVPLEKLKAVQSSPTAAEWWSKFEVAPGPDLVEAGVVGDPEDAAPVALYSHTCGTCAASSATSEATFCASPTRRPRRQTT